MSYQFVVALPKHLEAAYRAGEIVVTGGVARYADGRTIAAHLEQVAPFATNALGMANPQLALVNTAFEAIKVGKGMIVDTAKLNQIIKLTQQIQVLSTVNIAVSGVTLGTSVLGFAIVINQLNRLSRRIDHLDSKLQEIDSKTSDLCQDRVGELLERVECHIKDCISLIWHLENKTWSDQLNRETERLCNSVESLLKRLIVKYCNRDGINISLEIAQCLYGSYANLLKVYLTILYLHQEDLDYIAPRLQTLEKLAAQLASPDIIDELYEEYLFNQERRFSENELDIILELYRYGCKNTSQEIQNHYEIVTKTSLKEFKGWKKLLKASEEPLIWIEHST